MRGEDLWARLTQKRTLARLENAAIAVLAVLALILAGKTGFLDIPKHEQHKLHGKSTPLQYLPAAGSIGSLQPCW